MSKFFQNTEFQLDEILFKGRNKEYGAYALRHDADRILTKAMFVGVAFFAAVAITPFVINSFKTDDVITQEPGPTIFKLDEVDRPDKPEVIPPVEPVQPINNQKTIDTSVPTPVAQLTQKEKPVVKNDDYSTAVPGLVDKDGEARTITAKPPVYVVPAGDGGGKVISDPPVVKPVVNEIVIPDVEAKFDGGLNAFRDKFLNQFDGSSFDGSGETLKTTLTFVVEKDGSITNIKADGKDASFNSEAMRAVKAIRGKWTAGKLQGSSVRSYFKFPVSMKFE